MQALLSMGTIRRHGTEAQALDYKQALSAQAAGTQPFDLDARCAAASGVWALRLKTTREAYEAVKHAPAAWEGLNEAVVAVILASSVTPKLGGVLVYDSQWAVDILSSRIADSEEFMEDSRVCAENKVKQLREEAWVGDGTPFFLE